MLVIDTRSGYVSVLAMRTGTPTSSTLRFGSGDITVRPLKSTRLPLRFPLKRPCFPLSRCTKPRRGLPCCWYVCGRPGSSLLMYMAHCTCRKSQFSIRFAMFTPRSRPCRSPLLVSMIWMSFMVMSSSFVPAPVSISTLGRMHTGGTGMCVMMRDSGLFTMSSSSTSSGRIRSKSSRTRLGLRSSCTLPRLALSWSLCFTASSNSRWNALMSASFRLYFSWTILRLEVAFLTTPLAAPHHGQHRTLRHASLSFLNRALRCSTSVRGLRSRR
mmetsp:Transcript_18420/g.62709  ORF Transcript_18420/g.62709 Transcript_18420/m.62709 type:complete len:271 (+) Transcript_18420:390-1202(+)